MHREASPTRSGSPPSSARLLNDGISQQAPYRIGDVISTSLVPAWGDSGGHAGIAWVDGATSKISLYQGDQLLGEDYNQRIVTVEELSPEPQPYRIVVEGERNMPDRPYSTRTRTEWSFTSATTDYTVLTPLPLVQLDYAVATDVSGKAHRRTDLVVTPSHLKGATDAGVVRTVALEVSYDDGATWRKTILRQSSNSWKAQLDAPSRARFASLRTTARDTKGNSVSQTPHRPHVWPAATPSEEAPARSPNFCATDLPSGRVEQTTDSCTEGTAR
ncbi:hypothetical protein PV341_30860 [Streptomyces sp. PA03-1a]|nr:hypothetical protein [Streptomyces sp. PA03-1a]